jgi:hypothetical protein
VADSFIHLFMVYLTKLSVVKFIVVHGKTTAVVNKIFNGGPFRHV